MMYAIETDCTMSIDHYIYIISTVIDHVNKKISFFQSNQRNVTLLRLLCTSFSKSQKVVRIMFDRIVKICYAELSTRSEGF